MLLKLRDQTKNIGFKILVGVIVIVLGFFGFGGGLSLLSGDRDVASVNGDDITQTMLAAQIDRVRRQLAGQFG